MTGPTRVDVEDSGPTWRHVADVEEMWQFFLWIVPPMQAKARELGYALATHGSMRRDLDLVAIPWTDEAVADLDLLARELQRVACGFEMASYHWEKKPHGRLATSFCVCWAMWPKAHHTPGIGHVDLSVSPVAFAAGQSSGDAAREDAAYYKWRLAEILPLFQEARDALPAIPLISAHLRGLRLCLGERMDAAGTRTRADFDRARGGNDELR